MVVIWLNSHRLVSWLNIFDRISKNWYFIATTLLAFQVRETGGLESGIPLATIPLGALIRIPPGVPFDNHHDNHPERQECSRGYVGVVAGVTWYTYLLGKVISVSLSS
ncbi:hypothetical protein PM082_003178 [Marasmius tenuissimus]|nr:hypothetical protein PM082_000955 [Marasmius tenuissimus]KAJ8084409.1 hypothetical protein PM082_003178 [Marasmius tenuissimus]